MNNKIFNVNGSGGKLLLQALELAFSQEGFKSETAKAWEHHKDHGMILVWCKDQAANNLPGPMSASQILPLVEAYLDSEEAKSIKLDNWDKEYGDGDVSCEKGWRVYCDDWGHVGHNNYAIVAIRPAYMWYGK